MYKDTYCITIEIPEQEIIEQRECEIHNEYSGIKLSYDCSTPILGLLQNVFIIVSCRYTIAMQLTSRASLRKVAGGGGLAPPWKIFAPPQMDLVTLTIMC